MKPEAALVRWTELLEAEAQCKGREECPRLKIRELYFELNPSTLAHWRTQYGFYGGGIDRRLVFVAESPSDRRGRTDPAHFTASGQKGWRCWDYTPQDEKFRRAREKHGFQHCLITNAVKCGVPRPSTPANLTEDEARTCSQWLRMELELLRPKVVACLGESARRIFERHTLPQLPFTPIVCQLTHYSSRGSETKLFARWAEEFAWIKQALRARGLPESPVWWTGP